MSLEPVAPPPRRPRYQGCLAALFALLLVWLLVGLFIQPPGWPWWW